MGIKVENMLQFVHHIVSWLAILYMVGISSLFMFYRRYRYRWCANWTGSDSEVNIAHLEPEFCFSPTSTGNCTWYKDPDQDRHMLDIWTIEQHEDEALTRNYVDSLEQMINAPKWVIVFIALFGLCYWFGDYVINAKVTGFAEYLMWKVGDQGKTGLVTVGSGDTNCFHMFNNRFGASESFGTTPFYWMYIGRIIVSLIFAILGATKAAHFITIWQKQTETCCAYSSGCSTTKWYERADLVCKVVDDEHPFPIKISTLWIIGFILIIVMNIAEIGLIVFAIVRGGLEKMDIQVMAPYVANNEQINEAGGAAIVARNDPSGGETVATKQQLANAITAET